MANFTNLTSGAQPSVQSESDRSPKITDKTATLNVNPKSGIMAEDPTVLNPGNLGDRGSKIKVAFNSIIVYDTHEVAASGDAEYDLVAYVQGKKVDLTYASGDPGLSDASNGENITFNPGTEIVVDTLETRSNTLPLSIMVIGWEKDTCKRHVWTKEVKEIIPILEGPRENWLTAISDIIGVFYSETFPYPYARPTACNSPFFHSENEDLGSINKIYLPPAYDKVSSIPTTERWVGYEYSNDVDILRDYALKYTITVCPPGQDCPPPPQPQTGGSHGGGGGGIGDQDGQEEVPQ